MTGIEIVQLEIESTVLENSRTVWIQSPRSHRPAGVCLLLDGEYYIAHLRVAGIVEDLVATERIPPLAFAYVSHIDHSVRREDSICRSDFVRFLCDELVPWLQGELASSTVEVLGGLSLTGLSAAHAALTRPGLFLRVLCQSASFWWNDGWLIDEALKTSSSLSFAISVGSDETDEDVDHGDDLFQKESQIGANRRMRDALTTRGHRVSYREFTGGHDVAAWREDFPETLVSLFRPSD